MTKKSPNKNGAARNKLAIHGLPRDDDILLYNVDSVSMRTSPSRGDLLLFLLRCPSVSRTQRDDESRADSSFFVVPIPTLLEDPHVLKQKG